LTREEYVDIVVDQIERLDPSVVVHRLTGDAPPDLLIAPLWSKKKFVVMNEIDKELRRRHTHQGIHYKGPR
jgi:radical SAM superfamily enzyme